MKEEDELIGSNVESGSKKKTQLRPQPFPLTQNHSVLGRFLHKLNGFCKDEYGLDVDISDYHVYEFAKV